MQPHLRRVLNTMERLPGRPLSAVRVLDFSHVLAGPMCTRLQADSGMMMVTEREGNPPVAISNSWMDYVGGLHGCYAVMQALVRRKKDGKGRNIDLAQFETGVSSLGPLLLAGIIDGTLPKRMG